MSYYYKIYLDVCCLNRPFDDQTQSRIRLETEAITSILTRCQNRDWELISSTALSSEIAQTPSPTRREQVRESLLIAQTKIIVNREIIQRAIFLSSLGFKRFDALHLACAEKKADILLTTDDRFLRKANIHQDKLDVTVANPIIWLISITENRGEN